MLDLFQHLLNIKVGIYDNEQPYLRLFEILKDKNRGWGPKTSALLLKNIYQIHNYKNEEMKRLAFWSDAPELKKTDRLMLPVDAVIEFIFQNQIEAYHWKSNHFVKINDFLFKRFSNNMEVWDDLWFWGFITQRNTIIKDKNGRNKSIRKAEKFNEGKYWSLIYAPKDERTIDEIKKKCEEFVKILNQ